MFSVSRVPVAQPLCCKVKIRFQPQNVSRTPASLVDATQLRKAGRCACELPIMWRPAAVGLQRLFVTSGGIRSDGHGAPVPVRMKRIESHRLADQHNALLGTTNDA